MKSWSLHKVLRLSGTSSIKLHYIICIPYYNPYVKTTIRLKYTDKIYFKSSAFCRDITIVKICN